LENGTKSFEDIDIVFEAPPKPEIGRIVVEKSQDKRGDLLVLKRPVKFAAVKNMSPKKSGE